ncbi:Alpha-1,6-mannosylglycoprotein 6-beta-N-acetylglucosaminyltransferase B [Tupaia chinensis]|uniref:alpha-1,6-mannosyl-glycoprotein 6-beta-N-acetylglucosaminyltransferase n=1 Tax=Tupaia chinensis TaxID=246437 RepID=L9KZQ9_TUPCH|nr:Alpha-1,6-mannosylglycoprotein 6-beta-N-acetylglucosaminyltransferase B [Tupaia chinensis]
MITVNPDGKIMVRRCLVTLRPFRLFVLGIGFFTLCFLMTSLGGQFSARRLGDSPFTIRTEVMGGPESRGVLRKMSDLLELMAKRVDALARLENSSEPHRVAMDRSSGGMEPTLQNLLDPGERVPGAGAVPTDWAVVAPGMAVLGAWTPHLPCSLFCVAREEEGGERRPPLSARQAVTSIMPAEPIKPQGGAVNLRETVDWFQEEKGLPAGAVLMERIQAIAQNVSDIAGKVDQILRHSLLLHSKVSEARRDQCEAPSDPKFPDCSGKVEWMRARWTSDPCYAFFGVDGTECSFLIYLSEVEWFCPPLPWRNQTATRMAPKPLPKVQAVFRSNLSHLLELMGSGKESLIFMKKRTKRLTAQWALAAQRLAQKLGGHLREQKQILVHIGFLTEESGDVFSPRVLKGGPLGEMVQWADILATLYVLGHGLRVTVSLKELQSHIGFLTEESGDVFSPRVLKGGPLGEMVQWADILATLYVLGHGLRVTVSLKELQSSLLHLLSLPPTCSSTLTPGHI